MITSKPQDSDALIEATKDALGNTVFTATPVLIRFFADLADSQSQTLDGGIRELLSQAESENKQLQIDVNKAAQAVIGLINSLEQAADENHALRRELYELTDRVRTLEQMQWQ